jgi:hypothetical protein
VVVVLVLLHTAHGISSLWELDAKVFPSYSVPRIKLSAYVNVAFDSCGSSGRHNVFAGPPWRVTECW